MAAADRLESCTGFDWDEANLAVHSDGRHSKGEICVISARDINPNEGRTYGNMKRKAIPELKSEDDARKFWATADSTEYLDWSSATRRKFVHL